MILSMNKEFGVPLNDTAANKLNTSSGEEQKDAGNFSKNADATSLFDNATSYLNSHNDSSNKAVGNGDGGDGCGSGGAAAATAAAAAHTSRIWTPLDNLNVSFIAHKKEQAEMRNSKDFIGENAQKITEISQANR